MSEKGQQDVHPLAINSVRQANMYKVIKREEDNHNENMYLNLEKLIHLRMNKGLYQVEADRYIRLNPGTTKKYENGNFEKNESFDVKILKKIATYYGVKVSDIVHWG